MKKKDIRYNRVFGINNKTNQKELLDTYKMSKDVVYSDITWDYRHSHNSFTFEEFTNETNLESPNKKH